MPRRELLTPSEEVQLFAFPQDEGELIRLATRARADLTYIRQHRGDHNRLGLAIQMVYLRHPSRVLPPSEAPYPPLLGIVAAQLKVTPAAWSQYAKRDETRREHLQELLERFKLRQFDRSYYRELIDWLIALALQTTQGMVLAHAVANELRARRVLLPTVALIEKMGAIALTRAERETFRRLTAGLTDTHRTALDSILLKSPCGPQRMSPRQRQSCHGERDKYANTDRDVVHGCL
jgi:TnpA family transposase